MDTFKQHMKPFGSYRPTIEVVAGFICPLVLRHLDFFDVRKGLNCRFEIGGLGIPRDLKDRREGGVRRSSRCMCCLNPSIWYFLNGKKTARGFRSSIGLTLSVATIWKINVFGAL